MKLHMRSIAFPSLFPKLFADCSGMKCEGVTGDAPYRGLKATFPISPVTKDKRRPKLM